MSKDEKNTLISITVENNSFIMFILFFLSPGHAKFKNIM